MRTTVDMYIFLTVTTPHLLGQLTLRGGIDHSYVNFDPLNFTAPVPDF